MEYILIIAYIATVLRNPRSNIHKYWKTMR